MAEAPAGTEADPDLQIVLCTAYSDYSWQETVAALGRTDRLLILKKPFDPIEVVQLATALSEKWNTARRERQSMAWQTLPVQVAPVLPGTVPVLAWFAAEQGFTGPTH